MKKTLLLFAFLSALLVLPVAEGQKKRAKRDSPALSLQQARSRARLLHDVLSDTLDVIHRDYFGDGGGRKVVPSKALESVFYRQRRKWKVKAKWLQSKGKVKVNVKAKMKLKVRNLVKA